MVKPVLHRRAVLAALAASPLAAHLAQAQAAIDLEWSDLLPEGETPSALQGVVAHPDAPLSSQQPASSGVRRDWNGKVIRLPGFVVPVEFRGDAVTAFILVPYIGACVHVPPPPANQLVFVTTQTPYPLGSLFEPVNVTGMFGVSAISTTLAEIGYALSADKIEPFDL